MVHAHEEVPPQPQPPGEEERPCLPPAGQRPHDRADRGDVGATQGRRPARRRSLRRAPRSRRASRRGSWPSEPGHAGEPADERERPDRPGVEHALASELSVGCSARGWRTSGAELPRRHGRRQRPQTAALLGVTAASPVARRAPRLAIATTAPDVRTATVAAAENGGSPVTHHPWAPTATEARTPWAPTDVAPSSACEHRGMAVGDVSSVVVAMATSDCEVIRDAWLAQPANAWSSSAYLIAGGYLAVRRGRSTLPPHRWCWRSARWLSGASCTTGRSPRGPTRPTTRPSPSCSAPSRAVEVRTARCGTATERRSWWSSWRRRCSSWRCPGRSQRSTAPSPASSRPPLGRCARSGLPAAGGGGIALVALLAGVVLFALGAHRRDAVSATWRSSNRTPGGHVANRRHAAAALVTSTLQPRRRPPMAP
jgi:hypothetical protein